MILFYFFKHSNWKWQFAIAMNHLRQAFAKYFSLSVPFFFGLSGLSVLGKNPLYIQWFVLVCVMPRKEKRKEKKRLLSQSCYLETGGIVTSVRAQTVEVLFLITPLFFVFVSTFVLQLLFKNFVVFCSPHTNVGLMYHHALNSLLTLSE